MAQEDYNLDMNTESVQLAYSLPEAMMQHMASDTPPIHVTSDRQVRNLLEIAKTHEVRHCVSSLSKMKAVSEEGEEDDEWDEADEGNKELRLTAVRRRFSFRIYKSMKTLLVETCRVNGCGWKIRASVKHETNTFWVNKYVETHTCSVGDRIAQRKHCTPKALLYAQELVRGSAEDGYEQLPSYLEQISLVNLGSITGLELDSLNKFKYIFLSFGASIRGFQYQRRVIVVDGTHLSGKYEGVILVAAAQDGNFQIFSLAFAIVDGENDESWEWFFTKLASCVSDEYPLVIVSDRHTCIKNACDKVFPWATRGICYYHLQQNIVQKYKGKHLLYLAKGAAYAHTLYDFDRYMDEIRSANPELATYLENADMTLWSRILCQGDRHNIKLAASLNRLIPH
ncbi:PREDICTED: uncharacterized protein LOC106336532 [Brassica oleracea var. oleracea]|uniref:uncharacterized protein LOC106336532 n=1 Tax=Brassica oleracea var. oleracea TaxID=109376 RepID=UPI0006A6B5DF|nr:PREDICTED: uncharacterized protein LOC106336532 [Brassica oleracea var. oleracea]